MLHQRTIMGTSAGHHMHYLYPEKTPIDLRDLRVHLARQCRYGGALDWSVLKHLALCVRLHDRFFRGLGSLPYVAAHDLHEAYVGEWPTGLKQVLPGFHAIDKAWHEWVHRSFSLEPGQFAEVVDYIDAYALAVEMEMLGHVFAAAAWSSAPGGPAEKALDFWREDFWWARNATDDEAFALVTAALGVPWAPLPAPPDSVPPLDTLWYEDANGERLPKGEQWEIDEGRVPAGAVFQVSRFPRLLRRSTLRFVLAEEVRACEHPKAAATNGWVDGIEGRECPECHGTQIRKVGEEWPGEWEASGAREFVAFECSWPDDLVTALVRSAGMNAGAAVLWAGTACEGCLNVRAHEVGLSWGYAAGSEEHVRCNTTCEICKRPIVPGGGPPAELASTRRWDRVELTYTDAVHLAVGTLVYVDHWIDEPARLRAARVCEPTETTERPVFRWVDAPADEHPLSWPDVQGRIFLLAPSVPSTTSR